MQKTAPSSLAADPGRVRDFAAAIARKKLSPVELIRRYLDRIAEAEYHVQCWREVDAERALAVAGEREREAANGLIRGALHGVPVAIKDIIDVEGLPTRANSRRRENAPPASNDAEVVPALKTAGAILLGKVHTTEYAFFDPSPARNPHNRMHTLGGSSSGSAAAVAVAAGMAPTAVGTRRSRRSAGLPPTAGSPRSSRARAASPRSALPRSGRPTTRPGSTAGASTMRSICTRRLRRHSCAGNPSCTHRPN
jgi:Amidase